MLRRRLLLMMMQQVQEVWRTVVKTGTGMIVATDTTEGQPVDLQLQGWTKQNQYEGNQLFDLSKALSLDSYETVNVGGADLNGIVYNLKPNTNYTLSVSGKATSLSVNFNIANENQRYSLYTKNIMSRTIETTESGLLYVCYYSGVLQDNINNLTDQYFDIMLNEGSTALPYEPYTGNQPSPSPEYPQDVVNAGKYNSETGKYEVEVKLTGKNLFDITKLQTIFDNVEIDMKKNEIKLPKGGAIYFNTLKEICPDLKVGDEVYIFADTTSESKNAYLYPSGIYAPFGRLVIIKSLDDQLVLYSTAADPDGAIISNLMITKVNDSKFESYKPSQTVELTSDRPITKWDRLVQKDGQIGWEYGGKEIVFDGSDDEQWSMSGTDYGLLKAFTINCGFVYGSYPTGILSDKLMEINPFPNTSVKTEGVCVYVDNFLRVIIKQSRLDSVDVGSFKNWLKSNELKVQSKLSTPEFVPLPMEEQEVIKSLKTYFPTTVFSNNGEMFMQVEYKTKYGNVVYIDSGFLNSLSTIDSTPYNNSEYPNAWSTTKIPLSIGDNVVCDTTVEVVNQRNRLYSSNGVYVSTGYSFDYVNTSETHKYTRLMCTSGNGLLNKITVTHSDGTKTEYDVVDRR